MTKIEKPLNELRKKEEKVANQVVGNIGLYYICYELCRRGWNVMPTSRNARANKMRIIDVKYKPGPEDLGLSEDEIARKLGDSLIEFEEAFEEVIIKRSLIAEDKGKTEKKEKGE